MDDLTELLTDYANSENAFVRFATFLNPQAPETVLAQGAVSPSWLERYATAENSATPHNLLQVLQFDNNRLVRSAASRS
jgi:hypothetical protein